MSMDESFNYCQSQTNFLNGLHPLYMLIDMNIHCFLIKSVFASVVFASAVPKVQQMQQNPPALSQAHLPVILSCSFGGALVLLIVTRIWMYYRQHLKAAPNLLR